MVVDGRRGQSDSSGVAPLAAPGAGLFAPVVLGLLMAAAAGGLVIVEMAEPALQPGFHGIALSNAGNSPGARAGLQLFRDHLSWLPYPAADLILSPHRYIYGLRLAVVAMALMQAIALGVVLRRRVTSPWPWLVGPAVSSLVLLAYPPVNTDVFSYASFGWESNKGVNPYLIPPMSVPLNPFKTMNDWNHITTPYGPIWTGLSRLLVAMTRDQPFATAIAFKIVAAFSAIGLGIATYFLARRLTRNPAHAVAALVLVAWSPILLAESAGTAHNDAPMMALAVAGLLLATSDRSIAVRGGVPGITAAVLIKPVALPLLALVVVVRIAKSEDGLVATAKRAVVDLLPAIAFTALAFAPYWSGGRLPSAIVDTQRQLYFDKALHVNPLWVWAFPRALDWIGADRLDSQASSISRGLVAILLVAAVAIALSPLMRNRRRSIPGTPILEISVNVWTAVTVAFGLATINAHAWYAIWALAPVALIWTIRSRTTRTWWLAPYLAWLLMSFLVYHTWPALGTRVS